MLLFCWISFPGGCTEGRYRCSWHQIPPNTSQARAGTRYRQNYPTVWGPFLKESETQEPRDWTRDKEQKRVISFLQAGSPGRTWMRPEQLKQSLSKLFPEHQRQVGNWGQKGWMSLVALDNPSRCLFWESWSCQAGFLRLRLWLLGSAWAVTLNPQKKAEALLLKKELTSGAISVTKLEWVRITSSRREMGITFS